MSKWEQVSLSDVATIIGGSTPKTSVEEYWNGTNCWVTPAELDDSLIVINDTQRKITDIAIKATALKPLPIGTVLLSSRAPIGKVAITGSVMYCNQGFKNLICGERIYNKYLFWFLKGKTDYLNSLGRGATFKEISKSIVEKIQIPLPPLNIQKHIADTLDKSKEIIDGHKKQLEELDHLIKAIFYDMFGNLHTNDKGWKIKKLEELVYKLGDGLHGTPNYSDEGDYYFINGNNLEDGKIVITGNTKTVDKLEYEKYKKELNKDTMLVSINGTLGKVAFYADEKIVLGKSACYFNLKGNINRKYLYYVVKSDYFLRYALGEATGSTIKNVSLKSMRNFPIPHPELEIQNQFAQIVTKIEEQKSIVTQSLEQSQTLFNSLMSKYFDE